MKSISKLLVYAFFIVIVIVLYALNMSEQKSMLDKTFVVKSDGSYAQYWFEYLSKPLLRPRSLLGALLRGSVFPLISLWVALQGDFFYLVLAIGLFFSALLFRGLWWHPSHRFLKVAHNKCLAVMKDIDDAELAIVEVNKTKLKLFVEERKNYPTIGFLEMMMPYWKSIGITLYATNGTVWFFYSNDINGTWDLGKHQASVLYDADGVPVLISCEVGAKYPHSIPVKIGDFHSMTASRKSGGSAV